MRCDEVVNIDLTAEELICMRLFVPNRLNSIKRLWK